MVSNREFAEWVDLCLEERCLIMAYREVIARFTCSLKEAQNIIHAWDVFRLGLL